MTNCIICKTSLTEEADQTRGYDAPCQNEYRRRLCQLDTSEAEIRDIRKLPGDDLAESLHLFDQSLRSRQFRIRERAIESLRRHAARVESRQLGLTAEETVDYIDRRLNGDTAQELREEIENANRGIQLEREFYLADGAMKMLYALMEKADIEINRIKSRDFEQMCSTDDRAVATGLQMAVVTAIAYANADPDNLIAFADRQGWGRISRFVERNLGWIGQERKLRLGIERRLRAEQSSSLRLAA